eukprot:scaffold48794_cov69-Phaeocystis_antarctica.AAC.1
MVRSSSVASATVHGPLLPDIGLCGCSVVANNGSPTASQEFSQIALKRNSIVTVMYVFAFLKLAIAVCRGGNHRSILL